ncbi:hypothetical protein C5612_22035 [Pseudomonas frederiksbergensis]|uniref:Uncharacterized protein n=1 Tax=Pseudomonas frederiksbergensis TaxID=104087 RepID=A0A2S8HDR3_9PSED|nr:hypothetical protein C5612_22035 [Pseudomonas frederiksbergensis]
MGAGLLAKRPAHSTSPLPDTPLSRASPLPQGICVSSRFIRDRSAAKPFHCARSGVPCPAPARRLRPGP